MKIAYFDCQAGISGDMTLGALIDAGLEPQTLLQLPQKLRLPQVTLRIERVERHGLSATKVHVDYPHEHVHRHLQHIEKIIDAGDIDPEAKALARRIFHRLAVAEARVHNTTVDKVHFHEVGALDAIVDITGTAAGIVALGIQAAYCGPISLGGGRAKIAHGDYPVPAPATAYLLEGFPVRMGPVEKELVTPTGAAILAELVQPDVPLPTFRMQCTGYGAGSMQLEHVPNVLRLMLGETTASQAREHLLLLECQIDDMNPQIFPTILESTLQAGALDAYLTPIVMKKGRPGMLVSVLCEADNEQQLASLLFSESTTIGLRRLPVERLKLPRRTVQVPTRFGELPFKEIDLPDGRIRLRPEYEACRRIAAERGLAVYEVLEAVTVDAHRWQEAKTKK